MGTEDKDVPMDIVRASHAELFEYLDGQPMEKSEAVRLVEDAEREKARQYGCLAYPVPAMLDEAAAEFCAKAVKEAKRLGFENYRAGIFLYVNWEGVRSWLKGLPLAELRQLTELAKETAFDREREGQ